MHQLVSYRTKRSNRLFNELIVKNKTANRLYWPSVSWVDMVTKWKKIHINKILLPLKPLWSNSSAQKIDKTEWNFPECSSSIFRNYINWRLISHFESIQWSKNGSWSMGVQASTVFKYQNLLSSSPFRRLLTVLCAYGALGIFLDCFKNGELLTNDSLSKDDSRKMINERWFIIAAMRIRSYFKLECLFESVRQHGTLNET